MMTTINIEIEELKRIEVTPELAQRVLGALAADEAVPHWPTDIALEYMTINKVKDFIFRQKNIIRNLLGRSEYHRKVIIGDYGAGKTHIKECLLGEIQKLDDKKDEILVASLDIDNEYKNSNVYSDILSFPHKNQRRFIQVYKDVFLRLQEDVDKKIFFSPRLIKDLVFGRSVSTRLIGEILKELEFSDEFVSSFINLGLKKPGSELEIETVIEKQINASNGKELLSRVLDLLNKAKYKCLCIFLDEFSKMEADGWKGHRESYVNELADLHDLLGDLFNKKSNGVSVYLIILTHDRFWRGTAVSKGLLQHAKAQRFMERFAGPNTEFPIPPLGSQDIEELFIKIIALYQVAGFKVPMQIVEKSSTSSEEIFYKIAAAKEELTPRRVIKQILNIISDCFEHESQPWLSKVS